MKIRSKTINNSIPESVKAKEYEPRNSTWLQLATVEKWNVFNHQSSKSDKTTSVNFNKALSSNTSLLDHGSYLLRNDLKRTYDFIMEQGLISKSNRLADIHNDFVSLIKFANEERIKNDQPLISALSQLTESDILGYIACYSMDKSLPEEAIRLIAPYNGPISQKHWEDISNRLNITEQQLSVLKARITRCKNTDIYNSGNSLSKEFEDLNNNSISELHLASKRTLTNKLSNFDLLYKSSVVQVSPINFSPYNNCLNAVLINNECKEEEKTKVPPLDTVFHLLKSAIEFNYKFTVPLTNYLKALDEQISYLSNPKVNSKKLSDKEIINKASLNVPQPIELEPLRINTFGSNKESNKNKNNFLRNGMSLSAAVQLCLISFAILAEAFLANRNTSIKLLKRNCIQMNPLDGRYDIVYEYQKTQSSSGSHQISRPIPERIYEFGLNIIDLSSYLDERLGLDFSCESAYVLTASMTKAIFCEGAAPKTTKASEGIESDFIQNLLDKFSDWCQVPLSGDKRWYITTHQLRRLFAVLYFNLTDETGIEELSWMLGHYTLEVTYGYAENDDDIWLEEAIKCMLSQSKKLQSRVILSDEVKAMIKHDQEVEVEVNLQLERQIYQEIDNRLQETGESLHFKKVNGNKIYFYFEMESK